MAQSDVTALDTAMNEAPTERAFMAILPEIEALPETAVPLNIDLVGAATTVLGLLPELRGLRAQIAEELNRFDLERFDKLEQYALALIHAHGCIGDRPLRGATPWSSGRSWRRSGIGCSSRRKRWW